METNGEKYRAFITIEPGKRGGQPCLRGLRVTVADILGWSDSGMSDAEILADFPYLTSDDLLAARWYSGQANGSVLLSGESKSQTVLTGAPT